MRKALFIVLLGVVSVFCAVAQTSPDWYIGKPIKEIRFKGLKNISPSELEGITEPFIGLEYNDDVFLDLQSKLFALDFFENFMPNALPGDDNYDTLIIEFEVAERPVLDEIIIKGNKNIRKGDILDVVLLKRGDMINKTKVRLDSDAIRDLYLERGYPDAQVEGEIIPLEGEDNFAQIVFAIDEGNQTKIEEIVFSGNSFASDNTLRREMTTKKRSLFSAGVFMENKLEEDIQKIESYYWDNGFIDARVVDVARDVEYNEEDEKNYMVITIYIEEGDRYYYGGMSFEGNTLFTDEELQEQVRQKIGKILNKTKLEQDFLRVTDIYYDDGYIYNAITKEEKRDEENRIISYVVTIAERGRAHIENIIITGNEKTKDFVLYRELPLQIGDIFSKKKIIEGLQNLYNTGLFSVVSPSTPMGSAEGLMDLIITVEEGKTIDINFGVTFTGQAGDFPVMGFLKWTDRNFLGRGQEISVGTEVSAVKQTLNFAFNEKWLFGKRWSGGLDFSLSHELTRNIQQDILSPVFSGDDSNRVPDPYQGYYVFSEETEYSGTTYAAGEPFPGIPTDEEISSYTLLTDYAYDAKAGESINTSYLMDYNSFDFSLGGTSGYRWHTRVGRFGVGGGLRSTLTRITYDPYLYRPFNSTVRENLGEWKFVNKAWTNFSWDTRDIIYNPSKGSYISQQFTFVGGILGGTRQYIRSTSKIEGFLKLFDIPVADVWSFKMILAAHSAYTLLLPQFGRAPLDKDNDLTPQDLLFIDGMTVARGWGFIRNGEALWDNWLELRLPLAEQYIWWDFFISSVAIWEDKASMRAMNIDDFYFSFGGGARFTIPGLPIGIYLTKRFKTENGVVQWQTGELFNRENVEGNGLDFVITFTYELF